MQKQEQKPVEKIALVSTIHGEIMGILVEENEHEVILRYPLRIVMNGFYPMSFYKPEDEFSIDRTHICRTELDAKDVDELYKNVRLRMESIKEGLFDMNFANAPVKGSA